MTLNSMCTVLTESEMLMARPIEITRDYYGDTTIILKSIACLGKRANPIATKMSDKLPKPTIENVIFNDPATIVIWSDKTKTIVKCQPGDKFDAEKGLALAISKKFLGNKGSFNEVFKKFIPDEPQEDTKIEDLKYPFPVGTTIKIIDTTYGCRGADEKIGIVTNESNTDGLSTCKDGYNVKTSDWAIWRINPGAKVEVLRK